jgi:hypothetical protein
MCLRLCCVCHQRCRWRAEGRTPGAYGFFVSCSLVGYVDSGAIINDARIVMTRKSSQGINPLGPAWTSDAGAGPAVMEVAMVRPCH